MYVLIHRYSENMLYVDFMVGSNNCVEFYAATQGDVPIIHSTPQHFKKMLLGEYPEYQYSYEYPCLEDVNISDFEIRKLYTSYEELLYEEDE